MPRSIGRKWCEILLLPTAFNFGVPAMTKEACLVRPFLLSRADTLLFKLPRAPISTLQHRALDTTNRNPVTTERVMLVTDAQGHCCGHARRRAVRKKI